MATSTSFPTLLARLEAELVTLPDKPEETPESTLRTLWSFAAGFPRSVELATTVPLDPLPTEGDAKLDELIDRRLAGVPLAHLVGRQSFMGVELLAGPGALVPRKETELLGRTALAHLADVESALVIDLCTGSGNLAAGIATAVPSASIHAADLSVEAVELARRNMDFIGVGDRVTVHQGDLFDALDGVERPVDLVVCNPPYISSARVEAMAPEISGHEPRLAFDGGNFGLAIVGRLINDAPAWLKPGGWLCFEIGRGQGPHWTKALSRQAAYDLVEPAMDGAGEIRAIAARRG